MTKFYLAGCEELDNLYNPKTVKGAQKNPKNLNSVFINLAMVSKQGISTDKTKNVHEEELLTELYQATTPVNPELAIDIATDSQ